MKNTLFIDSCGPLHVVMYGFTVIGRYHYYHQAIDKARTYYYETLASKDFSNVTLLIE